MQRLSVLVLVAFFSVNAAAQVGNLEPSGLPVSRDPVRDPKALAVVQSAITALGGTAIADLRSWAIEAQVQDTEKDKSGTVLWQKDGTEFRTERRNSTGTSYIVSGHGKPAWVASGKVTALLPHMVRATFIPALVGSVLLAEFQDKSYSIEYGGISTIDSRSVAVVRTSVRTSQTEALVTPQIWYFDPSTGLPVRVVYRLPSLAGPKVFVSAEADLSDYRPVSRVLYPFRIVTYRRNEQSVVTLESVNPNAGISSVQFDAPTGGVQ